jgi:hypothetical protein
MHKIITSSALATALVAASASLAFAQDVGIDASVSASVNADAVPPRPAQVIHDARMQAREDVKNMMDATHDKAQQMRADFRAGVKADMQGATTSAERREVRQNAMEDRGAMRLQIAGLRADLKADIMNRLESFFSTRLSATVDRLNAIIGGFDNTAARIQSRIDKLNAQGTATTDVSASLASSVSLIGTAKADAQALANLSTSFDASTTAQQARSQMQAAIEKARASVQAAHQALMKTAAMLVQLSGGTSVNASANASTNVSH